MGVKEIILVDKDVYDPSNLNRQCLGTTLTFGTTKVETAASTLSTFTPHTKITPLHLDVTSDWQQVVSSARRSDVIFNGIDIGATFDTCVASLSKSLGIPLLQGQSYAWSYTAEYYNGQPNTIGAWDTSIEKLFATTPGQSQDETLSKWSVDPTAPTTQHCLSSPTYKDAALALISPEKIQSLPDLKFLPVSKGIPTRYIGSWVVPCMGCAVAMVGQWAASITGLGTRNPKTMIEHNLTEGCSEIEANGYMLAQQIEILGDGATAKDVAEMLLPRKRESTDESEHEYTKALKDAERTNMEKLFFSSTECVFKNVEGTLVKPKSITCELNKIHTQTGVPPGVVVPGIPSFAFSIDGVVAVPEDIPEVLRCPLLKIAEGSADSMRGYASGVRSAVIPIGDKWYRLKGCGNGNDGCFALEPRGDNKELTPRGCGFYDSVLCEMYMTSEVEKAGVLVGNKPIGAWKYATMGNDSTPGIDKWCGLFETLGDRRAGDHLMAGLLKLSVLMIPEQLMDGLAKEVLRARGADEPDAELLETQMVAACGMAVGDLSTIELYEVAPGVRGDDVLWNQTVERLRKRLDKAKEEGGVGNVLLHVAKRVAYESGVVMEKLKAAGISWGTYKDELGTHCNAHLNNLVVLRRPAENLLAAVDFDMAFTSQTLDPSKAMAPLPEIHQFEDLNGMRQVLSGSSFSSTGVSPPPPIPPAYLPFKAALYDTMVHTYDSRPSPSPHVPALDDVVADVVTLALILTKDVIA
eukprot:TRINITY_DN11541_c0_g1_i1.p1 TRINITY_DN11541_c0_g1~~TRINITY_DN11541_c0_g1_i1.p1  ORF type:complete len:759 (+),score=199.37 TRINITY_DN11541_c0_g1_i1:29-2278(+)